MKNKAKHSPRRYVNFIPIKKREMDNKSKQIIINLYRK